MKKKNQSSFPALPPTATGTVDSAKVMKQKSLVMGMGNGNRQQGIKRGWELMKMLRKKKKEIDFTSHFNPTLKYPEESETLISFLTGTDQFKDWFLVCSSKLISLFECLSPHFIQQWCNHLT